jgi:hypothetical protein
MGFIPKQDVEVVKLAKEVVLEALAKYFLFIVSQIRQLIYQAFS